MNVKTKTSASLKGPKTVCGNCGTERDNAADCCPHCNDPKRTTKHTPGPWKVATANDYTGIIIETHPDLLPVCVMDWDDSEPYESDIHDETKANARLIAAAPELLESLKTLYASICRVEGTESQYRCIAGKSTLAKTFDLIAKAEGQ